MQQAQSLLNLPGAATSLDLKLHHIFEAQTMATHISRLTGLQAQSWIETNTQLMNALQSQRLSTQMISSFVALSVALGIASVLAVSVVQRTREIGILRAMGASRQQMLRVFLLQGAMFGLVGSLLGSLPSCSTFRSTPGWRCWPRAWPRPPALWRPPSPRDVRPR